MMIFKQRTSQLVLLCMAVVVGVILGSILRAFYPAWEVWENTAFLQGIGTVSPKHGIVFYYVLTPLCCLAIFAVLGLSAVGLAGAPCFLVLRGAAIGAVLEILYASSGSQGIFTALLFVMPYACATTLVMTFGAREAFGFSMQIAGLVCEKTQENKISVQLYIVRFVVLFLLLAGLGILQCLWSGYVYPLFLNLF